MDIKKIKRIYNLIKQYNGIKGMSFPSTKWGTEDRHEYFRLCDYFHIFDKKFYRENKKYKEYTDNTRGYGSSMTGRLEYLIRQHKLNILEEILK